jgi:hypothetical protein
MNFDSELVDSPITDEGKQSENPTFDAASTVSQRRRRHSSSARKRTNDEVYEPVQPPVSSPRSSRFPKSNMAGALSDPLSQQSTAFGTDGTLISGQALQTTLAEEEQPTSQHVTIEQSPSDTPNESFVQDIKDFQQQLELEFQNFERSLDERDTGAELESLDWHDLEDRYKREIQPHIDSEQGVMTEFSSRFQVGEKCLQVRVCLTKWVCSNSCYTCKCAMIKRPNEPSKGNSIPKYLILTDSCRLRTRIALAQNSEQSLAQKQEHRRSCGFSIHNLLLTLLTDTKVLEAFQSAMALLGKIS